MDCTKVISL